MSDGDLVHSGRLVVELDRLALGNANVVEDVEPGPYEDRVRPLWYFSSLTVEEVTACVEAGAAWLNRECPDWFMSTRLADLDMGDGQHCVIGQNAACLIEGAVSFTQVISWRGLSVRWAEEHGFWSYRQEDYAMLTCGWITKILELRGNDDKVWEVR